jgi:hypothetical protein
MGLPNEIERQRLLNERARLHRQIAAIVADGVRIKNSGDEQARHAHMADMQRHQREFQTFLADLERFHRLSGPLGD